ncbi:MAG: polysaccharide deacetylase family protein, partial [Microcoleaceae cyanobacterium]
IQSHGYSHEDLTKLTGKALDNELGLAKFALRKCLHDLDKNKLVAAHIAYPYGAVNKSVEKALKPYYISGFLYDDKFVRVNRINNKMRISRLTINNKMTAQQLIEQATTASTLIPPTNQLDNDDNSKNPKVSKPRNRRLRNRKR